MSEMRLGGSGVATHTEKRGDGGLLGAEMDCFYMLNSHINVCQSSSIFQRY